MAYRQIERMEQALCETDSETDDFDSMLSGLCSQNRFSCLDERVGNSNGNKWENVQRHKRRRKNTGSVDLDTFSSMTNEEKLNELFSKVINIEQNQSTCTNRLTNIIGVAHAKVVRLEESSSKHNEQLKILTYKSIDLEARSRRNNLLFHGLADMRNENSRELIMEFLENELNLDPNFIPIERAHRLGHPVIVRQGSRITRRPLIVAFRNFPDTELILEKANALRGTNFRIERDLPVEIKNARKELWPQYKSLKRDPANRVMIVYPAKLVVNNRVVEDKFPGWFTYIRKNRMEQLQASNQNGMDRPSDKRSVPRNSQYTVQNNNQTDMNTNIAVGVNENSSNRNSDILTTTTTTVRKQPWENTMSRDNNIVNQNTGATYSQSSQSQSILQPQKQTKQKKTEHKKGVSKKTATQRTSNPKPSKKTLKITPKMKPASTTTRRSNTLRSQVNVNNKQAQPIGEVINGTASADSQRFNDHEQISPGVTQDVHI